VGKIPFRQHLEVVSFSTLTMGDRIGEGGFATVWLATPFRQALIPASDVEARAQLDTCRFSERKRWITQCAFGDAPKPPEILCVAASSTSVA
jgi:hypothetical protein